MSMPNRRVDPDTAAARVRHPLFARLFALLSRHEPPEIQAHRRELLSGLSGRVLELGAGSGANFPFYVAGVTEVLAVEPEPYMREQAITAAARAPVPITVLDGVADRLPVEDEACDAAVSSLVLCSVPDQAAALAELRRVLRPGGELRFYEHVLSQERWTARTQHLVDRVFWPRAFGGCHTARDTPAAIIAAGFEIERERRILVGPMPVVVPAATHVLGSASRR
jgi:SAM-dependent methyltransferase